MGPDMEKEIKNFIKNDNTGQICDFCTLCDGCPKDNVCYGDAVIEPPCIGMEESFVEQYIDKEAIGEYLSKLEA